MSSRRAGSRSPRVTPQPIESRRAGRPPASAEHDGRQALLRAARELFGEIGPAATTLRAIAERAGVRAPLINYYFGSKTGLYGEVIRTIRDDLHRKLDAHPKLDAAYEERFRQTVHLMFEALDADPYVPRLVMEHFVLPDDERTASFAEQIVRPHLERFTSLISEGMESGRLRPVDPRFAFSSLAGLCVFYFVSRPMLDHAFGGRKRGPEETSAHAESVADLLLRGLSPEPSHEA